MSNAEEIWQFVEARQDGFVALSDEIWGIPELAYEEFKSAALHRAELERQGFRVTEGVAGIPTALMGEAGEEGPVIAILGEYDALPGLSQEAGVAEQRPVEVGGHGHGCGHNLLGSAALLAATAVKDYLAAHGLKGRVRYYGCPAEEGGYAKTFMVRAGVFADVDVAICWHPAPFSCVYEPLSKADMRIDFHFTGRAAHAASAPHLGRSALDAVELMNVGVNYLREHMPSDARVHYAMLDGGGPAPNVVQANAVVRYSIRTTELEDLTSLVERVRAIADGAAMMTGTSVKGVVQGAVSNLLGNDTLEQVMYANFERLGAVPFDAEDHAFAAEIQKTLSHEDIAYTYQRYGLKFESGQALRGEIIPLSVKGVPMVGSTDLGDVSWVVPFVQAKGATHAIGTPPHSWQLTAQGKSALAHKGMIHTAKVMAGTAVDLFRQPDLIGKAKADLQAALRGRTYVCPIPPEVEIPLSPNKPL